MAETAGRVLGIDYGSKRVGLALSDPLRVVAGPVGTWANDQSLLPRLVGLITEQEITLVVVGMPYAPDGGKGAKAREVDGFIAQLRRHHPVPVVAWDESYTTVEAQRVLIAGGKRRKQRGTKGVVDTMAARLLLQQFLDAQQVPARSS